MLLTEFHPTSDTREASPHGRFALRVRCEAEDRIVDLPCGKTTIGSSPRCNLRIQQTGVHPVQCLVVCDADGLTARRWAADTWINGEPFDDARLSIGDHLSLGSVDLEVVEGSDEHFEETVVNRREEFVAESRKEYSPAGMNGRDGHEIRPEPTAELAGEQASLSWGQDTIHHTTVWVGDEEESLTAPVEHVDSESDEQEEPEVETPAEVVPAEAAREVYRQLQAANATSRSRCRKLLALLRTSRDACRTLQDQADGLANTKDELVAEYEALASERNMLREQLATAERRYAEWDHHSNQWEDERKCWDAVRAEWERERTEFDRQQFEWTQQAGEWESRLAGHVRRIEELEAQLAGVHAQGTSPVQAVAEPVPPAAAPAPPASTEHADPAWSSWEAAAFDWPNAESRTETTEPLPPIGFDWTNDPAAGPAPLAAKAETAEAQVPAWEREKPSEPPAWERHTPAWESEPPSWEDHRPAHDDETPARDLAAPQPQEDEEFELPIKPETDVSPAVTSPVTPAASPASAAFAHPAPSSGAEQTAPSPAEEKPQPASYIERFSHMFTEEEADGHAPPTGTLPPAAVKQGAGKPRNMPVIRREGSPPPVVPTDDEESIEDYMAKLLQRVRGDRPVVAASQAPPAAAASQPTSVRQPPQSTPAGPTTAPPSTAEPAATVVASEPRKSLDEQVPDLSDLARKAPLVGPPTNLVALRALANESARRAIGVHASKKHRRDAVSKFIVASLAGMASVWLMMLAPDWRDRIFIAACVTLLIALYWAGQAYARLVEMHRASEYDPEFDGDGEDLNPRLPIDGEG